MYDGDPDQGIVSVNTGIDVIHTVMPAEQVARELMGDFLRAASLLKAKSQAQDIAPEAP